jgi:fatty-acyl-CoA synthase
VISGSVLAERARLTPDKTALVEVDSGRRFTYAELDRRSRRCARLWREDFGLDAGDRVCLLAHNRVELLDGFFAAGLAGVIIVPLGTRLTAHELAHIVSDCQPRALVYDGAFADVIRDLRQLVDVPLWIALDQPASDGDPVYPTVVAGVSDEPWSGEDIDPEHPYCLLYTSGTTGTPKGVVTPHRMIIWNGYNTVVSWQLEASDVSPVFTPLYHAGGLGAFLVPIFVAGGTIVLHRGFDPSEIWRTIETERCTVVLGVPTIYKLLMEAPDFATADLDHVRWLISGGAPLPRYIIDAYQRRGVVFKQGYGLTEVGVNCFAMTVAESVAKAGSIGKPMMFTRAKLVDEEGRSVGDDEVGELCLRGPHVCRGYWQRPEATAAALDRDGWFHTGDLARRDADGFYFIAGRAKDMLISGGVNIYPAEIEAELLLHRGVADAAVVGVPDDTWGEVGVAFVVARGEGPPDPEDLAAFLLAKLSKYKIPREFIFTDELPRTAYGKVVKAELVQRYSKGE